MTFGRRTFLRYAAATSIVGLAHDGIARAQATSDPTHPITLAIFLRGGLDGLAVLVPFGDPAYATLRPNLRIANGVIEVASGLGLHPALTPLEPIIRAGEFRIAPAVGLRTPNRSHFEAQHELEVGEVPRAKVGFLNEALARVHPTSPGVAALSLAPTVPTMLEGPALAVSLGDIAAFQNQGRRGRRASMLAERYRDAPGAIGEAGRQALEAARLLTPGFAIPTATDSYPAGPLRGPLSQAARLIRADLGIRLFYAECGGWDTHANQGAAEGQLATRLAQLAGDLARLFDDLGPMRDRVRVVCFTEFGRTARENGSGGTDHGTASVMITLGHGLRSTVVDGAHPGLGPDQLFEGRDVRTTRHLSPADFGLLG